MAIMSNTDVKKVKVTPAPLQSIPDILPKNKRIESEVTMELNPSEIKRCMNFGTVKEVGDGDKEVALDPTNFNNKPEVKEEEATNPKEDQNPQGGEDAGSSNEQQTDSEGK